MTTNPSGYKQLACSQTVLMFENQVKLQNVTMITSRFHQQSSQTQTSPHCADTYHVGRWYCSTLQ